MLNTKYVNHACIGNTDDPYIADSVLETQIGMGTCMPIPGLVPEWQCAKCITLRTGQPDRRLIVVSD